ncbi:hypothetical protein ACLB1Q_26660 [Escherichia coli]
MDGIVATARPAPFSYGDGLNLLLITYRKPESHATLGWATGSSGCCRLSILLVLLIPWLTCCTR